MKNIILRTTLLVFIFLSSIVYTQAQEMPKAYKFFEFEKISDRLLKEKNQAFCKEIVKINWVGWIINYGKPKDARKRETQVRESLDECYDQYHDQIRLNFVIIEDSRDNPKTAFWVVPPGQEPSSEEMPKS